MSLPPPLDLDLRELLESGTVRCVIGPASTRQARPTVHLARKPDQVGRFVLSSLAGPSGLTHLTSAEARRDPNRFPAAVLARGCDTRMLNQLFAEHGLDREQVIVIGLFGCRGLIDARRLQEQLPGLRGHGEVREEGEEYVFTDRSGECGRVDRRAVQSRRCQRCETRDPLFHDHRFDLQSPQDDTGSCRDQRASEDREALEALPPGERRSYWQAELQRCIRCHACRDACPLCYCDDCVLDRLRPAWIQRSVNAAENTAYQLLRVMHLAGRCTGCGECARSCPVGVPLDVLMHKMEKEVEETYGHRSGLDPEAEHLLSVFHPRDPEEAS